MLEIETSGQHPEEVARILALLPHWFGIESAVQEYVESAHTMPTFAARLDGAVVGVCLVREHNPRAAEIELLAVEPEHHREGIGRALVDAVVDAQRARGVQLLQVKTLGPSADDEPYARTRAFYEAIGFIPLEERTDIWDADNPCLISVLPL